MGISFGPDRNQTEARHHPAVSVTQPKEKQSLQVDVAPQFQPRNKDNP